MRAEGIGFVECVDEADFGGAPAARLDAQHAATDHPNVGPARLVLQSGRPGGVAAFARRPQPGNEQGHPVQVEIEGPLGRLCGRARPSYGQLQVQAAGQAGRLQRQRAELGQAAVTGADNSRAHNRDVAVRGAGDIVDPERLQLLLQLAWEQVSDPVVP